MTQLAHTVLFTLHDRSPANCERLIQGCHEHLSGHPGTVFFSVGRRCLDLERDVNDRDFHVSLHLVFESREAHDSYQPHARHHRFIEECQDLWSGVRVFDSELEPR